MQKLRIRSRIVLTMLIAFVAVHATSVSAFSNLPGFGNDSVLTKDIGDVVDGSITDPASGKDPLRLGADIVGSKLDQGNREGLIYQGIDTTQEAWKVTVDVVRKIINYALGLIGLVALVYLLYHGFLSLTAGDDESQYSKGVAGVQYALIAIAGIAIARFILSLVYWMITILTTT